MPGRVNHKLHLGISLLTGGLWAPVYGAPLVEDASLQKAAASLPVHQPSLAYQPDAPHPAFQAPPPPPFRHR